MLNDLRKLCRLTRREPDERLVAESNRVYKTGYWLLVAGLGLYLWHGMMVKQVAGVNELQPDAGAAGYVDPFLSSWFLLVTVVICIMLARKGIFSFEPFEGDLFPVECGLAASFGTAAFVFVLATLMRAVAEFELMGPEGVNLLHDVVIASVFAMEVFVLALIAFGASYLASKHRRKRLEAEFGDD